MEPRQKALPVARLFGTHNRQLLFAIPATGKCGRNRQNYFIDECTVVHPFDSLLRAKAVWVDAGGCGEGNMKELPLELEGSPIVSAVLNEVRTFFEAESARS